MILPNTQESHFGKHFFRKLYVDNQNSLFFLLQIGLLKFSEKTIFEPFCPSCHHVDFKLILK